MEPAQGTPDYAHPTREYQWTLTQVGDKTRVVFEFRDDTDDDCLGAAMHALSRCAAPRMRGMARR